MKEEDFLKVIKAVIGDKYIGDDCACLNDLGIVISQDSLVEDVHFSLEYTTPYQLGYKSVMVNISDICASGAIPKYITIALSLPKNIEEDFIKEFYNGCKSALNGVQIIGGDITGAEKIALSVTAIGVIEKRKISSRKNAKEGYVIVTSGVHGSSAAGLELLKNNLSGYDDMKKIHLMPVAQVEFSKLISENIKEDYAMMDTSDGLVDALFKIAKESDKTVEIDFDTVFYDERIKMIFPDRYKELVLYGGEDYQLVAAIPQEFAQKYKLNIIGKVLKRSDDYFVKVKYNNGKDELVSNLNKCFNHF